MNWSVPWPKLAFNVSGWSALWFFLASTALAWSWFNPYVFLPWSDFPKDSHMAVCFALLGCVWFWYGKKQSFALTGLALACALLIAVTALQWALGYLDYGEHALWVIAALAACALLSMLSAQLSGRPQGRALSALLCLAIVLAALLNLGVAFAQRFGWMPFDDINLPGLLMASARDPMRPGGNFGQPNLLATFMLWGLLASAWLHANGHIGPWIRGLLTALLMFGVAMPQSRVVAVSMLVFLALAWWGTRQVPQASSLRRWALTCFAAFVVFSVALAVQASWSETGAARTGLFSDQVRWTIYTSYLQASLMKPWLGWGMTHLAEVQWTVWPMGRGDGIMYLHAHNIILDLALRVGWPITLLLCIGLAWRAWRRLQKLEDSAAWCLYVMVAVLFVHASVELPHMLACFFLPAAWWIGALCGPFSEPDQRSPNSVEPTRLAINGGMCLAATLALSVYLALMIWEYYRIESEFWRIRFEAAKVGEPRPPDLPSTLVLTPLADRIRLQATSCDTDMSPQQIQQLERSTRGFPSLYSIYLTACAHGLAGQEQQARVWMERLNRIATAEHVDYYANEWDKRRKREPGLRTEAWPPRVASQPLRNPVSVP